MGSPTVLDDAALARLCDPTVTSRDEAVTVVKSLCESDPGLDTRLVRLLPGRNARAVASSSFAIAERILDLLEAARASARVLPALAHLLGDPDPRLRSRATLLMGRRVKNTQLAEERMREPNARVRANAVESLWNRGGDVGSLLRFAAGDPNNRVAGNALLGLYRANDPDAAERILAMAAHPDPRFRATAAWVIGQTGSAEFLPLLEHLSRDLYASVRRNAARSIRRIRDPKSA
jgi:HEAT repeat protein